MRQRKISSTCWFNFPCANNSKQGTPLRFLTWVSKVQALEPSSPDSQVLQQEAEPEVEQWEAELLL